jgi:hypothetical protein
MWGFTNRLEIVVTKLVSRLFELTVRMKKQKNSRACLFPNVASHDTSLLSYLYDELVVGQQRQW